MRVAITGANGFVGSNLCNYLHGLGHQVIPLIRHEADTSLLIPALSAVTVDYSSLGSLRNALHDAEVVIHNAGKTKTLSYLEMVSANVGHTTRILHALSSSTICSQFIYISSQAASRPSPANVPISEAVPPQPVDWYGKSKALAERIVRQESPVPWTIIRPVPVYGPGERDFLRVFRMIASGLELTVGDVDQYFNLIHIDELVEFVRLCLDNEQAYREVFFAADGAVYRQFEFADLVGKILGKKILRVRVPSALAQVLFWGGEAYQAVSKQPILFNMQKWKQFKIGNWLCDISKAREKLGWDPQPDLPLRLRNTLDWYKDKGWL